MTGRDRIVLMGVVVLVVAAAGWMLVVSPERKEAKSLEAQVERRQERSCDAPQAKLANARGAQAQYSSAYALGRAPRQSRARRARKCPR